MGGGAEAVCLWMLEALKEEYDLTLFTLIFRGFNELNNIYGTYLSERSVRVISPTPPFLAPAVRFYLRNVDPSRGKRQKLISRFFRKYANRFDLAISGYNEMDLGRPGIQYIHWINVVGSDPKAVSFGAIRQNLTLTNSRCVAGFIKKEYGIDARVVYPPVVSDFPEVPWEQKEDGFVCIGRLCEAKSPHKAIQILKRVREAGFNVRLHIIGTPGEARYMRFLKKMVRSNGEWVKLHINICHKDFVELLSRQRYGIHWKKEPFGIVVAEMIKAGCIPFVRDGGGQVEVVGHSSDCLFGSTLEQAAAKIVSVLSDPDKQGALRKELFKRRHLFSTDFFMEEIDSIVKRHFRGRPK